MTPPLEHCTCPVCGTVTEFIRVSKIWCSARCKQQAYRWRRDGTLKIMLRRLYNRRRPSATLKRRRRSTR